MNEYIFPLIVCSFDLIVGIMLGYTQAKRKYFGVFDEAMLKNRVEIEDDGETTVFYFEAPEHKGKIKSVLVGDCDRVRVFEEKEII